MKKLQFQIEINASKEDVWATLWEDNTFRDWANIIDEGTYMVGEMVEGKTVKFISGPTGYGVTSFIDKLVLEKYVLFKHMVDTKDNGQNERANQWTGGTESYSLEEKDGITTLTIITDAPEELEEMFKERIPKVLERIKALSEVDSDTTNF